MVERFFIIGNIIGAWIFGGILSKYLQKYYSSHPPSGIIYRENLSDSESVNQETPPGTWWSRIGVTYTMTINMVIMIFLVGLLIINRWNYIAPYIAFELPIWVKIIGNILLWGYIIAGAFTITYNVNYIPLYRQIPSKYYLIIGGPYRFIKHPMYILKMIVLPILILMIFGTWLPILGIPGWFALPIQAQSEEAILSSLFGKDFEIYSQKTGRFFPKISIHQKMKVNQKGTEA